MIKKAIIKKTILSRWHKKMGYSGDYKELRSDKVAYSLLNEKYFTFKVRVFFISVFVVLAVYFMFIKSELYESQTAVMVQDLSSAPPVDGLGLSLLGVGASSQLQDSMVLKEYMLSLDMFTILDNKFQLEKHYKSDALDIVERLRSSATVEETLRFYQKRIKVEYDETSSIIHIAYAHTDPKKSQEILLFLLQNVEHELNELNRKKAKKQLTFIAKEYDKNKQQMQESIDALEKYQNKHELLDPSIDATSSNTIIAGLQEQLTQKKIAFKTKSSYLNADNYELAALKVEIDELIDSIARKKRSLSGSGDTPLNKMLFEYEKLKMQVDFDTEVYKNSLIQLEKLKLEILQNVKMLSVVSKPYLPDGYTYPNKSKVFITLIIVMLLLYGIFSMLLAIIKDHKE